jgi:hypothetical protein
MQARALKRLMQLPPAERLDSLAEGLGLIAEHVETLRGDVVYLGEADRARGVTVLSAQSEEEAAKALILLDVVRMDWSEDEAVGRQLGRFYSHLARCVYASMAHMRPADFREVREIVGTMRPSLYLDGPNDVDWIFRNQLLAEREDSVYVDYVHDDEGDRWSTPAAYDAPNFGYTTAVQDLVASLRRLGCTSRGGLDVIAEAWAAQDITDETHWQTVAAVNRAVVTELAAKEMASSDATAEDARRVIEQWTFPLSYLDLSEQRVSRPELEAKRDRRLATEGA